MLLPHHNVRSLLHTFFLCWLSWHAQAQLISTGFTVTFNSIYYFVSPQPVGNVSVDPTSLGPASSVHGFYPVTVVQEDVNVTGLAAVVQKFTSTDDVFQKAFLQGERTPFELKAPCCSFHGPWEG